MVGYCAFSHEIDYVTIFKEIQNFEGHKNRITGSKVTTIFLMGGFCLLVERKRWRVCDQRGTQSSLLRFLFYSIQIMIRVV